MAIEVIKTKNGNAYRAVYWRKHRRVAQKVFTRKYDAQQWLNDQERINNYGCYSQIQFGVACEQWLSNHSKIRNAPSTFKDNENVIQKSFIPFFGNLNIDEVRPCHVEQYIARLKETGIKNSTVNRHLQTLRAIFYYFEKKQCVLKNPVALVGLLPEEQPPFDYYSFEEADIFLAHTDKKYQGERRWVYVFYLCAFNLGLRLGEILGLKWDKVSFVNKQIEVSRSYDGRTKQIRETTKSRKIRQVGINTALLPELRALYENRKPDQELVFCKGGSGVIEIANFKRDFYSKDLKETGIRWIRIHDLRHTFASHYMMRGGNLYDLQKLLGHSNTKTTERYAHLAPESLVKTTELVAVNGGKDKIVEMELWKKKRVN